MNETQANEGSMLRRHPYLATFVASVLIALPLMVWVDRPVDWFFHDHLGHEWLEVFGAITKIGIGLPWFVLAIVGGLGCLGAARMLADPDRRNAWKTRARSFGFMLTALVVGGVMVQALKWAADRYRPKMLFEHHVYGFFAWGHHHTLSFPSGHSQLAFTVATALTALCPRGKWGWYAVAALVAFSRVALGEHFLSDILVGSTLGTVAALWVRGWFSAPGKPPLALFPPK